MDNSIIVSIVICIITFILGYITWIYLPMKFRREDKIPKISIWPLQERQLYFDITNHGWDILNIKIFIFWLQDGIKQSRDLVKFFNYNEDPTLVYSHNCSCLKKWETKKISDCPLYSDNWEIEVVVEGNDISNVIYKEKFILKNELKIN